MKFISQVGGLVLCGACCYCSLLPTSYAFLPNIGQQSRHMLQRPLIILWSLETEREESSSFAKYEETDAASRGLVSSLTNLVNSWSSKAQNDSSTDGRDGPSTSASSSSGLSTTLKIRQPPQSVEELRDRLQNDYVHENYLWTGKLDLDCFDPNCEFTDPTLSFQGTDTFTTNTQNLVPLVERFVQNYSSILLDITMYPEYVETRWNMVGHLNGLFWKPKIDVIGRTKFWYRTTTRTSEEDREKDDNTNNNNNNEGGQATAMVQVFRYDEQWEIPAYQALLQLVTPAGTIRNSSTSTAGGK